MGEEVIGKNEKIGLIPVEKIGSVVPPKAWDAYRKDLAALTAANPWPSPRRCRPRCHRAAVHLAFALFRRAVTFEGIAARAKARNASSEHAAETGRLAAAFARRATDLL